MRFFLFIYKALSPWPFVLKKFHKNKTLNPIEPRLKRHPPLLGGDRVESGNPNPWKSPNNLLQIIFNFSIESQWFKLLISVGHEWLNILQINKKVLLLQTFWWIRVSTRYQLIIQTTSVVFYHFKKLERIQNTNF